MNNTRPSNTRLHQFDRTSIRAREARLGTFLNRAIVIILILFSGLACFCASISALVQKRPIGWIFLGLTSIFAMLFIWIKLVLAKVPVGKTGKAVRVEDEDINDVLSINTMVALSKCNNLVDIAKIFPQKTGSGRFLAAHYAISSENLTAVAADLQNIYGQEAASMVLFEAQKIRRELSGRTVTGGAIVVAMFAIHPDHERLLALIRLDLADLKGGLNWYNYLHGLVKAAKIKRHDGGIARDLSFGYIPLLSRFGHNISVVNRAVSGQVPLASHRDVISQMLKTFSSNGRQNIALIGGAGVGKNSIVKTFAWEILSSDNKSIPSDLRFRQVFQLDSAAILSAAPGRGQVEQLINLILNEAYAAKNIILYLKDAHLFFEEGTGSVDISNLLLPVLDSGHLRMILSLDKQKFLEISTKNPALTNVLNKIMVNPANEAETLHVMQDTVPRFEYQHNVIYTILALKEAYRLSERYVFDLEMPGRALRLLESAANYASNGYVLDSSVGQAIERTQGVKVQVESDSDERNKLLNMENLIHQRMIDQVGAVKTVSDALRRSAAGVRNPNRPIGTFLFLGPTGVGKTELAKAVSEVYFGGEREIVRIDLNEYVSPSDVARLIAEPVVDSSSLTAQIMKNPFSVVLLDEIEKAHPQVLTTLLQMLDEGILRDSRNREISFRDAIVIATSNAGADRIRQAVSNGEDLEQIKEEITNALINSGEFKPELLNRFDEICIFKPLSKTDLRSIVALLIKSTNKNLAAQKITVKLTDDAIDLLVEKGYDPQLGARPMRRIVQKTVENIVAKLVLSGAANSGAEITITADHVQQELR